MKPWAANETNENGAEREDYEHGEGHDDAVGFEQSHEVVHV